MTAYLTGFIPRGPDQTDPCGKKNKSKNEINDRRFCMPWPAAAFYKIDRAKNEAQDAEY